MTGIFEGISKFMEMGNDPRLMDSAEAIGKSATEIPALLRSMLFELGQCRVILLDISLGIEKLGDPITRPPFNATDVEAAMLGEWPPVRDPVTGEIVKAEKGE